MAEAHPHQDPAQRREELHAKGSQPVRRGRRRRNQLDRLSLEDQVVKGLVRAPPRNVRRASCRHQRTSHLDAPGREPSVTSDHVIIATKVSVPEAAAQDNPALVDSAHGILSLPERSYTPPRVARRRRYQRRSSPPYSTGSQADVIEMAPRITVLWTTTAAQGPRREGRDLRLGCASSRLRPLLRREQKLSVEGLSVVLWPEFGRRPATAAGRRLASNQPRHHRRHVPHRVGYRHADAPSWRRTAWREIASSDQSREERRVLLATVGRWP